MMRNVQIIAARALFAGSLRGNVYGVSEKMETAWKGSVALWLLASALAVNGLYFHISETETKCFIEEVPSETMIVGT